VNYDLPPEELTKPTPEDRMNAFAELLKQARAGTAWEPMLMELLWTFEKFLVDRPPPPKSWSDRLGKNADKYDYYQIVLPGDYLDPYLDDLENVRLLREKFIGQKSIMALENFLVTRNHFLFGNEHAAPVCLPRPLLMLESYTNSPQITWDCSLTVFPDGSWQAYNMDRDDEDSVGEDIGDYLERWMPIISFLKVLAPVEGRDFGWFKPVEIE
jgi:hypothetical protein